MLTEQQKRALDAIDRSVRDTGLAPTMEELRAALDLRSKSGAMRLVNGLEERGFIRRLRHRVRAMEVIRRPTPAPGDVAEELRAYLDACHGPGFAAALLTARALGPVEFFHQGRRFQSHPEAERDAGF